VGGVLVVVDGVVGIEVGGVVEVVVGGLVGVVVEQQASSCLHFSASIHEDWLSQNAWPSSQ